MTDADRLAALLEHAQDVVSVLDEDGRIQYVSPAVETVLELAPSELVGVDAFERVHPEDRETARQAFVAAVETGDRQTVTHRYRTADGEWVWLESVAAGEHDETLGGYVVTARDVSDRMRAERERRQTREALEELTDNADDVLWMFSADWSELLFVNDAYEDIYGQPVEGLWDDPGDFVKAVHPDDRERVSEAMARLSAGESVDLEYRVNQAENYGRWVWVRGTPVTDEGEVVRIAGFSRDVTERREYRRQLQVMDRILRHNLHNDMNVVLGYAQQAHAAGDETVRRDIERTIERGRDLLETVAKQREIVELLNPSPDREVLDLAAVARSAAEDVEADGATPAVQVDAPTSARVEAIAEVDQAVEELLDNAIEYGGDDPIDLTVRENHETVVLEVADRGPGIPREEITVLTGEEAVGPLYHGSGLGLWLVNWVVRRSDGELAFETNEPTGSRVRVRLPKADA
jgi:PAS domain S-box-containing protein